MRRLSRTLSTIGMVLACLGFGIVAGSLILQLAEVQVPGLFIFLDILGGGMSIIGSGFAFASMFVSIRERRREVLRQQEVTRRLLDPSVWPQMRGATIKAKALLDSFLTPHQRLELRNLGYFTHYGKDHAYQIHRGTSMNVKGFERHESGGWYANPSEVLCAYPEMGQIMPQEDTMLAQLLWLRSDEKGFRKAANIIR